MKVFISNSPASLANIQPQFTVEAEYGDIVVEGSILTLAHHGPRSGNEAPCLHANDYGFVPEGEVIIGISHMDLDTIGGIMAIQARKPEVAGFWELAAFVDINGPHKLFEASASPENIRRLQAYWAWSQEHRVFPPRDGSVLDITDQYMLAAQAVDLILEDDPVLLERGEEFVAKVAELNKNSFICTMNGVIKRVSDQFVNHLYSPPESTAVAKAVLSLNTKFNSLTLSIPDPRPDFNCAEFLQGLFGPTAGGHAGIAGSPRGQVMTTEDLDSTYCALVDAIDGVTIRS